MFSLDTSHLDGWDSFFLFFLIEQNTIIAGQLLYIIGSSRLLVENWLWLFSLNAGQSCSIAAGRIFQSILGDDSERKHVSILGIH